MGKEIKSGNCKVSVPMDNELRDSYLKVCETVKNKSMAQDIRDYIQIQVKKFKSMVPDEPKVPS
jgi:hypothetical protein